MRTKPILFIFLFIFGYCIEGCDDPVQNKATNIVPPVLVAPPDGTTSVSIDSLTLKWSGTASRIELDYTPSFNPPFFAATVTGNQYNMPPDTMAHNQLYFWRAGITIGSVTYWSNEVWHFTTE